MKCTTGKVCYGSAHLALVGFSKRIADHRTRHKTTKVIRPYRCHFCGSWHQTSQQRLGVDIPTWSNINRIKDVVPYKRVRDEEE